MLNTDFSKVPLYDGEEIIAPEPGTGCLSVRGENGQPKLVKAFYETPEGRERLHTALTDVLHPEGPSREDLLRKYDIPLLSVFPDAVKIRFEGFGSRFLQKSVKGKWQKAVFWAMHEAEWLNSFLFRKHVYDTRISEENIVALILSGTIEGNHPRNVFYFNPEDDEDKDTEELIVFGNEEPWQVKRNVLRAIEGLKAEGIVYSNKDGLLQSSVLFSDLAALIKKRDIIIADDIAHRRVAMLAETYVVDFENFLK